MRLSRASWWVLVVLTHLLAPRGSAAQAASEIAAGKQLFDAGRFEPAERQFELAAAKAPNDPGAWSLLGQARFAQSRWADAREAFKRAHKLAPNDARPLGNIGVCSFSLQELDLARDVFERAAALDAGYSRAHMYLGRIAADRGDNDAAEREFRLAAHGAQPEPLAPFYFGLFLFQGRRLDDAAAQFERALELSPDLPGAHLNLGLIRRRQGEAARAERHLRRFRELTEVQVGDRQLQMKVAHLLRSANAEIEASRFDSALAAALEAAQVAPELPLVHQFLARIHALRGNDDEAAREQERFRVLSEKAAAK